MKVEELIERCSDHLGVRRVFGEPVERDGVTIVPVAVVMGGAGCGPAPADAEGCRDSGGFGMCARGIGVYTIHEGKVRFVPALDPTVLSLTTLALVSVMGRMLSRRRRRH
jgi:uncharacterized spore protein YtfJ